MFRNNNHLLILDYKYYSSHIYYNYFYYFYYYYYYYYYNCYSHLATEPLPRQHSGYLSRVILLH